MKEFLLWILIFGGVAVAVFIGRLLQLFVAWLREGRPRVNPLPAKPRDIELRRPNPLPRDVEPYYSETVGEAVGRALRAGTVSTREAAEGMRLAFRERPLPDWLEVTERQRKRIEAAFNSNVEIGFYGKQFEELRRKIMASEITDADAVDRLAVLHADRCLKDPGGWHPLPMAVLQRILSEKGE